MRKPEAWPRPPHRFRRATIPRAMTAFLSLLPLGAPGLPFALPATSDPVRVVSETDLGIFELEVDVDRAPVTAANFLRYVDGGHYDGGSFHRTVHADNQPSDSIRIAVTNGKHGDELDRASALTATPHLSTL